MSCKLFANLLRNRLKTNFHFGQSSTAGLNIIRYILSLLESATFILHAQFIYRHLLIYYGNFWPLGWGSLSVTAQDSGPGAEVNAVCLDNRRSRVRNPPWPSSFIAIHVSSPPNRKYLILWGTSVTER